MEKKLCEKKLRIVKIFDPIPSAFQAPTAWGVAIGLFSTAIFFAFVTTGDAERGKIAAFSLIAVLAAAGLCWNKRAYIWFWAIFALAVAGHAGVVFLIDWVPERGPAMKFAPFALLDALALTMLIQGIAKLTKS